MDEIDSVALYSPDVATLVRNDPPYAHVQAQRRSILEYDARPLTARQLGEFLFRVGDTARYWRSEAHSSSGKVGQYVTGGHIPTGGGLHELKYYLLINACRNLSNGLYRYDPRHHRLRRLSGPTRETELLLLEAATTAGIPRETLQVHLILTAYFARLSGRHGSSAHALILKDVGVVYQTMYLAATAMGLAPCGLGCGDSDLLARAARFADDAEVSVGEFLLGSRD